MSRPANERAVALTTATDSETTDAHECSSPDARKSRPPWRPLSVLAARVPRTTSPDEDLPVSAAAMSANASPTLYRRANVRARADSPSVAELEAQGWKVEHVDPRYGTALCMKLEEQPAERTDDEDVSREVAS